MDPIAHVLAAHQQLPVSLSRPVSAGSRGEGFGFFRRGVVWVLKGGKGEEGEAHSSFIWTEKMRRGSIFLRKNGSFRRALIVFPKTTKLDIQSLILLLEYSSICAGHG
jgi:hypothetical protein